MCDPVLVGMVGDAWRRRDIQTLKILGLQTLIAGVAALVVFSPQLAFQHTMYAGWFVTPGTSTPADGIRDPYAVEWTALTYWLGECLGDPSLDPSERIGRVPISTEDVVRIRVGALLAALLAAPPDTEYQVTVHPGCGGTWSLSSAPSSVSLCVRHFGCS